MPASAGRPRGRRRCLPEQRRSARRDGSAGCRRGCASRDHVGRDRNLAVHMYRGEYRRRDSPPASPPMPRCCAAGSPPCGPAPRHPIRIAGPGPGMDGQCSNPGVDRGVFDLVADKGLEFAEILFEAVGQLARGLVIGAPCRTRCCAGRAPRSAPRGSSPGTSRPKFGSLPHRRVGEPAVERGAQQRPRMGDRHAPADAIGAARPAGVDEPALRRRARRCARPASWRRPTGWRGMNGAPKQVENVACGALPRPFSVPATRAV